MPLSPGARLGPYEVIGALGAGGMGEVYRARDTSLNRDVALKILPEIFAADTDRLARFEREAQALAALNHPNIAQVYAIERLPADASGATPGRAIVMELVEGEDLATQTARGPIALADALPLARQIALALETAHEAGIVHRDLKPANVKVRPDGTAKVLDFGLAKAVGGDGAPSSSTLANSPTLTARATELGVVLGTAAYMSPEQAKGRAVDRRADVWAFGCVLYEMLTGRRAFDGDDVTEVMAAVIRDTPDLNALPAATPPAVRRLLRRALEKDVRKRLRDMGDAGVELDDAMSSAGTDEVGRASGAAGAGGPRRSPLVWLAATAGVGALAALSAWALKPEPPVDRPVARFSLLLDDGVSLNGLSSTNLVWSPDGRRLAYRASGALFVRDLDAVTSRELLRAPGASQWFSPDGNRLLFRTPTGLSTVPVTGGPVNEIVQLTDVSGVHWFEDDTIVYSDDSDIFSIPSGGGAATVVVKGGADSPATYPQVLPGGRRLLFTSGSWTRTMAISVKDLGTDDAPREVLTGVGGARYAPTGHLVYGIDNRLMAVPFDPDQARVLGPAVPLPETVYVGTQLIPQAAFSGNGSLAYVSGVSARLQLSWVDAQGQSGVALPDLRNYSDLMLSPDGRRAVFHLWDQDNDIWVADLERGTLSRATSSVDEDETPVWSPDGRELAFATTRGTPAILRKAADGGASAPEQMVFEPDGHAHVNAWSSDGTLILEVRRTTTGNDLLAVNLQTGEARDLLVTPFNEGWSRLSPDGRWLAYVSNESGSNQVYVQPYPAMNTRVQVSAGGGVEPVWSRDGRQLYFRSDDFMSVSVTSTAPLEFGTPKVLFKDRFVRTQSALHTHYDVGPDGRFLAVENPDSRNAADRVEIHVVLNWFEELKRLVPVK